MPFLSNKEKDKFIEHYVDRETMVATKWVGNAETANKQQLEEMRNAEKGYLTTR